jgi:hypothetical protein
VIPIRRDRAEIEGIPSFASLVEVPGRAEEEAKRHGIVLVKERDIVEEREGCALFWFAGGIRQ